VSVTKITGYSEICYECHKLSDLAEIWTGRSPSWEEDRYKWSFFSIEETAPLHTALLSHYEFED
jgi:hypothetical protein